MDFVHFGVKIGKAHKGGGVGWYVSFLQSSEEFVAQPAFYPYLRDRDYYYFCISRDVALKYHPTKFGDNCKTQC